MVVKTLQMLLESLK